MYIMTPIGGEVNRTASSVASGTACFVQKKKPFLGFFLAFFAAPKHGVAIRTSNFRTQLLSFCAPGALAVWTFHVGLYLPSDSLGSVKDSFFWTHISSCNYPASLKSSDSIRRYLPLILSSTTNREYRSGSSSLVDALRQRIQ